jgi:hypothetical protein
VAVGSSASSNALIDLMPWKMVAIGGDFLSNRHFCLPGNQMLFQQIIFHLFDRELPTEPEAVEEFQLHLTRREVISLTKSSLATPLLFPALLLLLRLFRR